VWRIVQEPKLFSRYAADGWTLLRFLLPRVLLWLQYVHLLKQYQHTAPDADIFVKENSDSILFSFGRNLQISEDAKLRQIFTRYTNSNKSFVFDFQRTEYADSTFWGLLLLLLQLQTGKEREIIFINYKNRIEKQLKIFNIKQKRS
jgi:N-acetylglucosaminyldiphosphoundecaprenol N-acetyl-beta-D-mannosaminyltransferase